MANTDCVHRMNEIEAIDEIFRKQLSTLREINNALELKMKQTVQKLAEEMARIKANEFFTSLLNGQESTEYNCTRMSKLKWQG
jgi:hypothetical protein